MGYRRFDVTNEIDRSVLHHYPTLAEAFHGSHVMTDKEHGSTLSARHIMHLANRLLLKFGITHSQHFINHENLGIKMGGNGEAQADNHAR